MFMGTASGITPRKATPENNHMILIVTFSGWSEQSRTMSSGPLHLQVVSG